MLLLLGATALATLSPAAEAPIEVGSDAVLLASLFVEEQQSGGAVGGVASRAPLWAPRSAADAAASAFAVGQPVIEPEPVLRLDRPWELEPATAMGHCAHPHSHSPLPTPHALPPHVRAPPPD